MRQHAVWLGLSGLILSAAWLLQIDADGRVVLPVGNLPVPETCTFHRLTGYGCPGCGLTRSFIAMARGSWWEAWSFHPLGGLVFVFVVFQIPYRSGCLVILARGSLRGSSLRVTNRVGVAILAIWLVAFVLWRICGL